MIRDRQMARPVVFPAPAGINRCASYKKLTINSVPRASGDKPDYRGLLKSTGECSPRQRG
ncbi:TPA: hypothetical protein JLL07_004228 [Escherichia coli]|nr:hypothetical protein [Escherichia coli]HAW0933612.1 hypothetical protein [Escherichia coli]